MKQALGSSRISHYAIVAIVALLIALPTLQFEFTLDDPFHAKNAVDNTNSFTEFFTEATWPGDLYRPLLGATWYAQAMVFGPSASALHFGNALLYALAALAALFLLRILFRDSKALIISLVFAVHPIHVEAVANIAHRTEVLAFLFGSLSLGLLLRYESQKAIWLLLSGAFAFLLALLSKESAFVFIPLLALVFFLRRKREPISLEHCLTALALMCVMGGIYSALRIQALGSFFANESTVFFVVNPLAGLSLLERLPEALSLLGKYVLLCFAPLTLSHDYSYAVTGNFELVSIDGFTRLATLIVLVALIVASIIRRGHIWFGPCWFLTSFAITANIFFPIGTAFAERLAFTPSLGMCILLYDVVLLARSNYKSAPRHLRLVLALFAALFAVKFLAQQSVWESNTTLHTHGIAVAPQSAKAQQNYAIVLMNQKQFPQAITHLERAIDIYPAYGDAAYRISLCYEALGENQNAETALQRAFRIQPDHTVSRNVLAWKYVKQEKTTAARQLFLETKKINPESFSATLGLYATSIQLKDAASAQKHEAWLTQTRPQDPRLHHWRQELHNLLASQVHTEPTAPSPAFDAASPGTRRDDA